ncbi:MAG TPA: hypothetical protein PLD82_05380 [Spirochaetota bacterium]|nr:hypothetical protein [Spirochaetota bacterium]
MKIVALAGMMFVLAGCHLIFGDDGGSEIRQKVLELAQKHGAQQLDIPAGTFKALELQNIKSIDVGRLPHGQRYFLFGEGMGNDWKACNAYLKAEDRGEIGTVPLVYVWKHNKETDMYLVKVYLGIRM